MGFWGAMERFPLIRHMVVLYAPNPQERSFVDSAQRAEQEQVTVSIAALDARQSRQFFGVPMARRAWTESASYPASENAAARRRGTI